jgi:hypothetical protein
VSPIYISIDDLHRRLWHLSRSQLDDALLDLARYELIESWDFHGETKVLMNNAGAKRLGLDQAETLESLK